MRDNSRRDVIAGSLARHPLHDIEPHGSVYAFGKVHRDRASLQGYRLEALKATKRWVWRLQGRAGARKAFLILARPRSGSTLLVHLLSQVENLRCDREVFHFAVARPLRYLENLIATNPQDVYGCKLLSYQMFEIQKLRDPLAFIEAVRDLGFTLIHLRRRTFAQSLSLSKSLQTGVYDRVNAEARGVSLGHVTLDPEAFRHQLAWNAAMLSYEDLLMSAVPHLRVDYEDDLTTPDLQQKTVDRICAALDHPSSPVSARLKPTSGADARVLNEDALRRVAAEMDLA